jgi:hypothetical protein
MFKMTGNVARMGEKINSHTVLVLKGRGRPWVTGVDGVGVEVDMLGCELNSAGSGESPVAGSVNTIVSLSLT